LLAGDGSGRTAGAAGAPDTAEKTASARASTSAPARASAAPPTSAAPQERVLDVTLVPAPPSGPQRVPAAPASPPAAGRPGARGPARTRAGEPLPPLWIAAMAAATLLLGGRIAWRRRRPRLRCPRCRARMERLGRVEAFAHLDGVERTEQLIGEVHHEVWSCPGCGEIAKRARERPLPEAVRRLAPPVGSAAHRNARTRQGPSLFPGGLDGGASETAPDESSHAAGTD
jgi:hypothetical protein